jgi:AmmeMemoRadiSam system protein B
MRQQSIRPPAVAGSWYPATAGALTREVDGYLEAAGSPPEADVVAIIAPHAGIMYSGPVAAHAYAALRTRRFEAAVLVGPSHFVGFDGVALPAEGAFDTPLGPASIDAALVRAIAEAWAGIQPHPSAHGREHSLEMQLPFLRRVAPEARIVPLLMGYQDRPTILALGDALGRALQGRSTILIASTDLSHYFDEDRARALDGRVLGAIDGFDPEELLAEFERYPEHERGRSVACGGGPAISVMIAARALGARSGRVLRYATSADVSGDRSAVVGYVAGVFTK